MDDSIINTLVADWDEVYKKGQLSLWILLAIYDGKKYAAQINQFMMDATNGSFSVKEQSLYRALRRFSRMGLIHITEERPTRSGPRRKYYEITADGEIVLGRFVDLNIAPLLQSNITKLLQELQAKGT